MKTTATTTGIIRRIDDLGRIAIPKEIRRKLDIKVDTPLEICISDDGVLLKPYKPEPKNNAKIAEEWLNDYKNMIEAYSSKFNINGNTVTCEIIKNGRRKTGEAKCNPCDTFNPTIGMMLSFCRAVNIRLPLTLAL